MTLQFQILRTLNSCMILSNFIYQIKIFTSTTMSKVKVKETQIPLKILVDKVRNKVLFAEADYSFVDILFSFMMLPMGTIVRLVKKNSGSTSIGCLSSLYESVANLTPQYFLTKEFKQMLLHPRNPSEAWCRKLKLNVDDTKLAKYFICEDWECSRGYDDAFYSTYETTECSCGELLNREIGLSHSCVNADHPKEGVFVTESATFMITDDLCVMPSSPSSSIRILSEYGIKDTRLLEERTVNIGLKEVVKLLELTLVSRSALTNLFLCKTRRVQNPVKPALGNFIRPMNTEDSSIPSKKMVVKVFVQKSNRKPLFLVAEENFADFIVSLLTIPLGKVVGLLSGSTSAVSLDKLYQSISKLHVGRYLISKDLKDMLIHPKLVWNCVCKNQFFTLKEASAPNYICRRYKAMYDGFKCYLESSQTQFGVRDQNCTPVTLKGPKFYGGIVRGPAMFTVTDDLVVEPLSSLSTLTLLDKLKVPLSDVEECEVSIGIDEALCILKASLTSSSALFSGINLPLKKPKKERKNL